MLCLDDGDLMCFEACAGTLDGVCSFWLHVIMIFGALGVICMMICMNRIYRPGLLFVTR